MPLFRAIAVEYLGRFGKALRCARAGRFTRGVARSCCTSARGTRRLMAKFDIGTRLTTGVGMVVIGLLDLDNALAWCLRVVLIAVGAALAISASRIALEDVDGAPTAK